MTDQSINLDQWVEKQLELIRLEYEEEVFNNE